ncbi:hypothetical protein BDP27DRAFT_519457 [Rhodocollybia butyracea]|uniref:Uncharacterized protein n=1 Tax=Rhodocollybia butyracea TaxID=206335 RepID=A0A9P5PY94_9AGAR|nr:hypothetical protein BDP27DRAFT_519457 [Rhodocollybia butyracea]
MAFYSPYYTIPTTPIVSPTSWLFTPSPTPAYTRTPTYSPAAAYSPAAINYRHKHTPVWPTTSPLAVPAWPYLSPAAPAQPVAQPYAQPYSVYATGTPLVHMTPMAPYSPYFTYTPDPRPIYPESPAQHHFHYRRRRQSRIRDHDQDQERSNRRNRTHREHAWAWDRDGRGPAAEATPVTPRHRPAVQRYPNLLPHPPRFIRPRNVPSVPRNAGNIQINPILRFNPVNASEPVLEWDIRAPIQTARVFPLKTSPPTPSSAFEPRRTGNIHCVPPPR